MPAALDLPIPRTGCPSKETFFRVRQKNLTRGTGMLTSVHPKEWFHQFMECSRMPSSCCPDEMEWMVMNMDHFFAPSIQLGCFVGEEKYVASPNCAAKIEEILRRLNQDKARWHFRRALFLNQIISRNLLPTLTSVKEDKSVLEATVKVLQELMTPVECLMPIEIMSKNVEGYRIINELEKSIYAAKKLFTDGKSTKALVDVMNSLLQDSKSLSLAECEFINHCLLLVRNLLHVSSVPSCLAPKVGSSTISGKSSNASIKQEETEEENESVVIEDQIMWNLFAARFDKVIIQLLTCDQQHLWNITMVQLVSLMYREQQQTTISKLINEWLELSLAESSEDDENNPMTSSSSDAISTSDPVSDSSERLSPIEMAEESNVDNSANAMNSLNNNRKRKADKEDSCKDSGFGRSGSNMDSSQDDSVSEGAQKNKQSPKSQRTDNSDAGQMSGDQSDKPSAEESADQNVEYGDKAKTKSNTQQQRKSDESCNFGIDPKEVNCDDKCFGECDDSMNGEKESDRGGSGSEGGSEGSPEPMLDDNAEKGISLQAEHFNEVLPAVNNESGMHDICSNQDQMKDPRKVEEIASSGDSCNKPAPQLPKHHKPMTGQKRSRHVMSQKMLSETQENNESSNSTGSECDEGPHAKRPHHQKPHKMLSKPRPAKMLQKALQEKNIKRNKLLKRKDISGIKAKALLHHRPTKDDISNLLKEFTIDFVLNGYSNLVQGLRLQVMLPYQIDLDKSHLLWLITYFLQFAVELDLELNQICPVLSVDVVSYLAYEGVMMQEELEMAVRAGETNLLPHVRRLHLVVTALREFFIALDVCLKKDHNAIDIKHVLHIKEELGQLVEVRQLFVMLIRMYRPGVLNLNYLQDLITTNHRFLTTQEATSLVHTSVPSFDIVNHVKQFATMDMMKQYGRLLENFNINDETVNDCIFTMMHHVAGDLRNVNVLLQPCILRIFLRIWKEEFELCVDWADLIEYILRKCTRVRTENPDGRENTMFPKPLAEPVAIELTDDDLDQLYTLYKNSSSEQDLLDKIRDICCDDSIEEPIKTEVIQKLLARGFITSSECTKLCAEIETEEPITTKSDETISLGIDVMQVSSDSDDSCDELPAAMLHDFEEKKKDFYKSTSSTSDYYKMLPPDIPKEHHDQGTISEKTEGSVEGNMTFTEDSNDWDENSSLSYLIDKLKEEGYSSHIQYLQLQLLEACYSKLKIVGPDIPKPEPVAFHFSLSNQSIPLIPWTVEQEEVFNSEKFRQLLGSLGFHLPSDTGKVFPRIPNFWCPDVLFMVAKKLGPIDSSNLRVSVEQMQEMLQKLRTLSLTGSFRTHTTQGNELAEVLEEQTFFTCDESLERISDCSMENNRSTSSSPFPADEKLILPEYDDPQINQLSQRVPEIDPTGFPPSLAVVQKIGLGSSTALPASDNMVSTIETSHPHRTNQISTEEAELSDDEVHAETSDCIIPPMDYTENPSNDMELIAIINPDLLESQADETLNHDHDLQMDS